MKIRTVCAAAALAVAAAWAGAGPIGAQARAPQLTAPIKLVLTVRDVPAGYKEIAAFSRSDAQADKLDHFKPGTLEKRGRVSSYQTSFRRNARSGIIEIQDTVVAYRTPAGAKWQLSYVAGEAVSKFKRTHAHRIPVGSIGDLSFAYESTATIKGLKVVAYFLLVQRKNYGANLVATGYGGSSRPDELIRLARLVDSRMRAAK